MKQRIHNHENKEDTAYSTLYDAGMGRRRETNSGSIEETREAFRSDGHRRKKEYCSVLVKGKKSHRDGDLSVRQNEEKV